MNNNPPSFRNRLAAAGLAAWLSTALALAASAEVRPAFSLAPRDGAGVFSLAEPRTMLFTPPLYPVALLFLLAHVLLLIGYVRHALRETPLLSEVEPWVWFVYPLGLVLLPLSQLAFGWITRLAQDQVPLVAWVEGALATGLAIFVSIWRSRKEPYEDLRPGDLSQVFSVEWLYRALWWIYRLISRWVSFLTDVLEGEGGILWGVLWVALLVSLFLLGTGY